MTKLPPKIRWLLSKWSQMRPKNNHNNTKAKGAFPHPVYICVYRTALRFFITYLGLLMSMEKKVITSKTQCNAENACETGCGNSPLDSPSYERYRRRLWKI